MTAETTMTHAERGTHKRFLAGNSQATPAEWVQLSTQLPRRQDMMTKDSRTQAVLNVRQCGQVATLAGVDVVKGGHKGRQLASLGCGAPIQRQ